MCHLVLSCNKYPSGTCYDITWVQYVSISVCVCGGGSVCVRVCVCVDVCALAFTDNVSPCFIYIQYMLTSSIN